MATGAGGGKVAREIVIGGDAILRIRGQGMCQCSQRKRAGE